MPLSALRLGHMEAQVSDALELPAEDSSYYDYLCGIPIGAKMSVTLAGEAPGDSIQWYIYIIVYM